MVIFYSYVSLPRGIYKVENVQHAIFDYGMVV